MTFDEVTSKPLFLPSAFAIYAFITAGLTLRVSDHIFFWDTIQLASKHAHFFFDNGFSEIWLPDEMDSGHPPVFGFCLALCWLIFGKSLLVSHLVILPFLWGIGWLTLRLGQYFGDSRQAPWLLVLLLADAVFMGQAVLVSPDICLFFFFLLGLWGIFSQRQWMKILAALGLAMVSTRGMMTVVALYCYELILEWQNGKFQGWRIGLKLLFQKALPYVPSGIFALLFITGHYYEKGWIGYHADSPWSYGFTRTRWEDVPFQIALYGWRLLDFGRVFLFVGLIWLIWRIGFKRLKNSLWSEDSAAQKWRQSLFLFAIVTLLLSITFFVYKGLNNHRYLMPVFFALSLATYTSFVWFLSVKQLRLAILCISLGMASGNFWVYPPKVSQAWDCSLAHWPHYELRSEMLDFIADSNIPLSAIGTTFPEIGPLEYKDLRGRFIGFVPKDLNTQNYIFYSNTMNDFTDEELDALFDNTNWKKLKKLESATVCMILFERVKQ